MQPAQHGKRRFTVQLTNIPIIAFKDELAPYQISKGTIRFPLSQPVPVRLIGRIAKFRAKEVSERSKAKATAPRRG